MEKPHEMEQHCGLRSEPDGAPTTRSGSSTSVLGHAGFAGQNGLSSPKSHSKEGSVCSDRQSNSPNNNLQSKDNNDQSNANNSSHMLNLASRD
jgi:hypothetical protein